MTIAALQIKVICLSSPDIVIPATFADVTVTVQPLGLWVNDHISDDQFLSLVQYLIDQQVLSIRHHNYNARN